MLTELADPSGYIEGVKLRVTELAVLLRKVQLDPSMGLLGAVKVRPVDPVNCVISLRLTVADAVRFLTWHEIVVLHPAVAPVYTQMVAVWSITKSPA